MASSSTTRSQIVDYTYQHVASLVAGHREGTRTDQITQILQSRVDKLRKISEPFAKPSDASKKKIQSGSVQLSDGVKIGCDDVEKEVVFAVSDRFEIDQVDALVLVRSFFYNEGLPETSDSEAKSSMIDELLTAITPFYYSERLHVARTLIALVRCLQDSADAFHKSASTLLPNIISDPVDFTKNLVSEFLRKAKLPIPESASKDPRAASQWAKQNAKEQLVLVETLFWMLWDYIPCNAPIVVAVFEAAYEVDFGYKQENSTSMLDDEGTQIQRDLASLWVLITIEVLNLESLVDPGLTLANTASDTASLDASPSSLEKVHRLVMAHTSPGYVCTMLAWAFYLKGLSDAASLLAERPQHYVPFLREIRSSPEVTFKKGEKELHATIVGACLRTDSGLFAFLSSLLTQSPLFVPAIAWKASSSITDSNAIAYRALVKGLIMTLMDYEPVELMPDFDGLVEVWIGLFGGSGSTGASELCKQYWDVDWKTCKARRAIIDVARSRFPVQFSPLVRILRSMTGSVQIDATDPETLSSSQSPNANAQRDCSNYVFHYFAKLPTYTQVIPAVARTGANSLYDRILDRPGPSSATGWTAYANLWPVTLPGGSLLPQKSVGRLLCPDSSSESVIVAWQHEHSGWKVLLDVLIDYVNRKQGQLRSANRRADAALGRRTEQSVTLQFDDIGCERDGDSEAAAADALLLLLSVIEGNPAQTELLMRSLEEGGPLVSHSARDKPPPDVVQLIFEILEDALSRAQNSRIAAQSPLVAPAFRILSVLLSLPGYSNRVWLYLRSNTLIFGSDRGATINPVILSSERASGQYVMTLALLRLVRALLEEAIASLLTTQLEQPRLQAIKEEVLLRALRFVHGQIWLEHSGWRYARLGDRFEIGRSVISLYSRVIQTTSVVTSANTFASLSEFVSGILIFEATPSTITPLVHTLVSGRSIVTTLANMRRFAEVRRFASLLEVTLRLTRMTLHLKTMSAIATKLSLLEQLLCTEHSAGTMLSRAHPGRVNPVDALAYYIRQRELGTHIPLEAVRALVALCTSLSSCSPTPPSIIGYFSDAQATLAALIKIIRHPYDDLPLRNALWTFICIAVEKQPALAVLIVSGQFRVQSRKGKGKEREDEDSTSDIFSSTTRSCNAVEAACETLSGWKELWEANPQLLASVMSFLDVVWSRSLEHIATLEPTRGDAEFWKDISAIAREELGPSPDYSVSNRIETDDGGHCDLHDAVSDHAYRTKVKAHALRILGSDIAMHIRSAKEKDASQPSSYKEAATIFQAEDHFTDAINEAVHSSYDPSLYDQLVESLKTSLPPLTIESLRSPEPINERQFGDNFLLSTPLLRDVLRQALVTGGESGLFSEQVQLLVYSVNLNLSLAHAQLSLADSWCFLLEQLKGYLRGNTSIRAIVLESAASISRHIKSERRSGDYICTVHGGRLRLLLALLEAAWFSADEKPQQVKALIVILENIEGIISSDAFPPGKSFLRSVTNVFHPSLLQIIYFCAKSCQRLGNRSSSLKAENRLLIGRTFTSALILAIDALRLTFDTARTRLDTELDKDMELLVAVFQQCTHPSLYTSSTSWLTRCQETDVIKASLQLLGQADVSGFSDLPLLRSHGRPLYAPHALLFHMALASIPFAAERLASENVVVTYCNNSISTALSEAAVETTLPELPGERSPAHKAYTLMLANISGTINSLSSPHQFIESQVVGFVQLYGKQISRALSWNNDETLTLPFLEELEYTIELFYLMTNGSPATTRSSSSLSSVMHAFSEHALQLLQQLNYALTHPKHLAGLLEPVTAEERLQIDRETADISVTTLNDLMDSEKKPLLTSVVQRLFSVTTNVLLTLSILSGADTVLLSDSDEWPIREAVVVPHSKVTMGEPASIGTLLELGNCSYEILRTLVDKKAPPLPSLSSRASTKPSASPSALQSDVRMVRQALESVLVYACTQLVMWLTKHDVEMSGEMELDDQQQSDSHGHGLRADASPMLNKERDRERRMKRKSLTLADRLRRGMTGEMTMDLQSLVVKAKPVVQKTTEMVGKPDDVDLVPALATFIEERVLELQ